MDLEEKSDQRFTALMNEARSLSERGYIREEANKYMQAVLCAPTVWTKCCFIAFQALLSVLHTSAAKGEIKQLKRRFLHNEEEPAVYRVQAALIVGSAKWFQYRNIHDAAEYFRLGLKYISQSLPEDDNRVIIFADVCGATKDITVKTQLGMLKDCLEANIAQCEGKLISTAKKQKVEDFGGGKTEDITWYQALSSEETLMKRSVAGGKHCDACGKNTEELGIEDLSICSRCRLAFYCSSGC